VQLVRKTTPLRLARTPLAPRGPETEAEVLARLLAHARAHRDVPAVALLERLQQAAQVLVAPPPPGVLARLLDIAWRAGEQEGTDWIRALLEARERARKSLVFRPGNVEGRWSVIEEGRQIVLTTRSRGMPELHRLARGEAIAYMTRAEGEALRGRLQTALNELREYHGYLLAEALEHGITVGRKGPATYQGAPITTR